MIVIDNEHLPEPLYFDIEDNCPVSPVPAYASERGMARKDPLRGKFNRLMQKYGVAHISYVADVIKQACERPTPRSVEKAATFELRLQRRGLTNEEHDFLLMFDFPTRFEPYFDLSH